MIESHFAGLRTIKHEISVPLDYQRPDGPSITLFAREIIANQTGAQQRPYLVYFQGGPGFAAGRPTGQDGWLKRALQDYRVLLLDQRGTGLSTPVNFASLEHLTPAEQAQYLSHFRADNIVRDAETLRRQVNSGNKWSVLGQSFGGFCVLRYLSAAPQGLQEAFITGGIPPLSRSADEVYRATYQRVIARNVDFRQRFADAENLLSRVVELIKRQPTKLATGEILTVEMLQLLGIHLGMEQGPEALYYLLEQAVIDTPSGQVFNPAFLTHFCEKLSFNAQPIYALLHESIYCQGAASDWSAHRIRQEFPVFETAADQALYFTGEMVYPWMFDQLNYLKPLKECAELLAHKADWPVLYDLEALKNNQVPVAAAIYSEDMYVESRFSLETAAMVGNLRYWLTSEYEHNGLGLHGDTVFDKLIQLNQRGPSRFR